MIKKAIIKLAMVKTAIIEMVVIKTMIQEIPLAALLGTCSG